MLTRLLLSLGALASFAAAQSSSSAAFPTSNVTSSTGLSTGSTGILSNVTGSTGILSNVTSSTGSFTNLTSSTGAFSNTTSTGAFINSTTSTGSFINSTSSTGSFINGTSSSGSIIPPIGVSSSGAASVIRCGGAGYDLSSIANMDLTLDDGDFVYAIRPCGTVSEDLDLCDGQMCQDGTVISYYEPSLVNWYAIPNGVNLEVQNGDDSDCEGPRESDINFICSTDLTPRLISVTETTTCHYRAIVHTAAACTRNSTFQPGIGDAFTSTVCGGGAYDLSSINNADITAMVGDYNWTVRVCGLVSNPLCALAQPASICQQQDDSVYKLADYTHDLPLYEINANGMNMSLESGESCGDLGNRTTLIQFECDLTATTPILLAESEYYMCEYYFRIRTAAVCGAPFQIRAGSSSSALPPVASSSTGLPRASSSASFPQASSSSAAAPTIPPVFGSSSTASLFPVDSSTSEQLFPVDSSSTADENIDDPGANNANMASISGVAVMVSLMAVAVAL